MRLCCFVPLSAFALLLTEVSSVYVWTGTEWKWKDSEEGSGDGDALVDDEEDNNNEDYGNIDDEDAFESSGDTDDPKTIDMKASVNFDEPTKQINLEDLNCRLKDGTKATCTQVTVRMKYSGIGVPNRMNFNLNYNLDARKKNNKRMFLLREEGKASRTINITMQKDMEWKESFLVYLVESQIHDKLTSLAIHMKYRSADRNVVMSSHQLATDSLGIQKDCGNDNLCVPDLSVRTRR